MEGLVKFSEIKDLFIIKQFNDHQNCIHIFRSQTSFILSVFQVPTSIIIINQITKVCMMSIFFLIATITIQTAHLSQIKMKLEKEMRWIVTCLMKNVVAILIKILSHSFHKNTLLSIFDLVFEDGEEEDFLLCEDG